MKNELLSISVSFGYDEKDKGFVMDGLLNGNPIKGRFEIPKYVESDPEHYNYVMISEMNNLLSRMMSDAQAHVIMQMFTIENPPDYIERNGVRYERVND